ncbi:MAG: 50S ribosomal protein L9, partial [Alphaproteobacteria bacterium]
MEVVLLENIKNLGQIGDVVDVKRGHGRNFLIKYGKALKASKENIDLVNKKKAVLNQKNLKLKQSAKKILDIINHTNYKFSKRA